MRGKSRKTKYVIGVDEAGRGPLAGPIAVAAILAPKNFNFSIVNKKINKQKIKDSKKLSSKQREKWFQYLKNDPKIFCAVSSVSAGVINKVGIQKATKLAVARVLRRLFRLSRNRKINVLLDGSLFAPKHYSQKTIIRGDETVPVISAASIIAKVKRDKKMLVFHKKFPQYGFDRHKGYGTALHRRTLEKCGLSKIHRKLYCRTFLRNK
ncbi:MAG: ribonuclease HII [Patescibacteria group bacterium]|mgnify:CR=1 FL=1